MLSFSHLMIFKMRWLKNILKSTCREGSTPAMLSSLLVLEANKRPARMRNKKRVVLDAS